MINEIKQFFIDLGESTTWGAGSAWFSDKIIPVAGNLAGGLIVTAICTTMAFFLKKWLRKNFPDK
jgi:uncharacterized protein (DUF697 family)